MLRFTVGPLQKPTSFAGALKHFGISATSRRKIKNNGICLQNGVPASMKDLVHQGDSLEVILQPKDTIEAEDIPLSVAYEDVNASNLFRAFRYLGQRHHVLL